MATIRSLFKRNVAQNSSNNNELNVRPTNNTSSDILSTNTSERLNNRPTDGYISASTLGGSPDNNVDSLRHPLFNISSAKPHRRFLSCLIKNSTTMYKQDDEQVNDENICILDTKLPKELIFRIFSFLDYQSLCRCAQVSKYWNTLALDGSNWQSINLKNFQRDINGTVLENLSIRCGKFLKRLNIENCKCITDHNMGIVASHCQNLERLTVKHCGKLTNTTLFYLSKNCAYLKHINISSCHHIDDQGVKTISTSCSHLESWDISWCMHITENGVRILGESCPKLTTFKAEGCTYMTNYAAIQLGKHCSKLLFLDLNRCSSLTDDGLIGLTQYCLLLETLIIANCTSLTDNTLIALGKHCHQLKKLDATLCSQFSDVGFLALAQGCHLLQRIDLEDCTTVTDETMRHLADNCPNIQNLTLSRCEQITDDGVRYIGSSVNAQDNLRVIELDNCPSLTDISINHLLACQNLQRLDIFDCQQITRNAVKRIQIRFPNLKIHAYFSPRTPTPTPHATTSCSACIPSCCSIA
ncbi:unnamed protein product [Rotaria socialis]|uniref:F-box domain-containing protein n=2 Tax=Rotaria socialis TaxID=392032 RepID=A0A820X5J2_9BILA|nr:unnamed protein product [Rotaria socialis]CAF4527194.1 unnamed protein product [Rotaria socialis]